MGEANEATAAAKSSGQENEDKMNSMRDKLEDLESELAAARKKVLTMIKYYSDLPNGLVPSIDLDTSDEAIKNRNIPFTNDLTTLGDTVDHLLADFNNQLDKMNADLAQLQADKDAAEKESARLNSELGDLEKAQEALSAGNADADAKNADLEA